LRRIDRTAVDEARIRLAEELLREGVYRSREKQASSAALRLSGKSDAGSCGLGEKAAIELDLSPRGRELFAQLFAGGLDETASERFGATMSSWIEAQDALDRKRNHFLKAFRGRHGSDRTKYAPKVLAEYDEGLARIATEEDGARRRSAESLAQP
jgi:hypothetical protein